MLEESDMLLENSGSEEKPNVQPAAQRAPRVATSEKDAGTRPRDLSLRASGEGGGDAAGAAAAFSSAGQDGFFKY